MSEDVKIFHPELGLTSDVTEEAADVWVAHGWQRLEDGTEAYVSDAEPVVEAPADEPEEEN